MRRSEALKYRTDINFAASLMTDEQGNEHADIFIPWASGTAYAVGDRRKYGGKLYRCVQAHTSQDDWTPDVTPALWVSCSVDEWPDWVQPTGAQDAYNKGDKVTFEGKHYISLIDGNTWSPTAYPAGWELVE